MAPIHEAASKSDLVALRRELDAGVSPYEKAHRQRLTAIFLSKSKFQSLPAEIVSHIVSFGFNCGCY